MNEVIFICTGNICRSPIAQYIFKSMLERDSLDTITTSSMGIHGLEGKGAHPHAIEVCHEHAIDLTPHVASALNVDRLLEASLIFVMEMGQKEFLRVFFPLIADRIFLLGSWPGAESARDNIRDPMGKSIRRFRESYEAIHFALHRIYPEIKGYLGTATP